MHRTALKIPLVSKNPRQMRHTKKLWIQRSTVRARLSVPFPLSIRINHPLQFPLIASTDLVLLVVETGPGTVSATYAKVPNGFGIVPCMA